MIKDNLKAVRDKNTITLFINGEQVWVSKNPETCEQFIEVKDSGHYEIVLKLHGTDIDKISVNSLENSWIKIISSKPHWALGLRGLIWGSLINLFRKKYKIKIKKQNH